MLCNLICASSQILSMLGNFSSFCCRLSTFQNKLFQMILSGTLPECQMVWILIRTDVLLGLTWVQTVYKSYQQITKIAAKAK